LVLFAVVLSVFYGQSDTLAPVFFLLGELMPSFTRRMK